MSFSDLALAGARDTADFLTRVPIAAIDAGGTAMWGVHNLMLGRRFFDWRGPEEQAKVKQCQQSVMNNIVAQMVADNAELRSSVIRAINDDMVVGVRGRPLAKTSLHSKTRSNEYVLMPFQSAKLKGLPASSTALDTLHASSRSFFGRTPRLQVNFLVASKDTPFSNPTLGVISPDGERAYKRFRAGDRLSLWNNPRIDGGGHTIVCIEHHAGDGRVEVYSAGFAFLGEGANTEQGKAYEFKRDNIRNDKFDRGGRFNAAATHLRGEHMTMIKRKQGIVASPDNLFDWPIIRAHILRAKGEDTPREGPLVMVGMMEITEEALVKVNKYLDMIPTEPVRFSTELYKLSEQPVRNNGVEDGIEYWNSVPEMVGNGLRVSSPENNWWAWEQFYHNTNKGHVIDQTEDLRVYTQLDFPHPTDYCSVKTFGNKTLNCTQWGKLFMEDIIRCKTFGTAYYPNWCMGPVDCE